VSQYTPNKKASFQSAFQANPHLSPKEYHLSHVQLDSNVDYASGRLKNSGTKRPATAKKSPNKDKVVKAKLSESGAFLSSGKSKKQNSTFGYHPRHEENMS